MVSAVSHFLAVLAFLSVAFIALTILGLLLKQLGNKKLFTFMSRLVSPMWLEFVFVVSLVSTLGSLFYSEIAHFQPCLLCWYQRIAMYPQALISYLALVRRDYMIRPYLIALSVVGALIAAYHNWIQWAPVLTAAPCDESGVSCVKRYPVAFDFVTIPMMSLTAFLLLLTILLVYSRYKVSKTRKSTR